MTIEEIKAYMKKRKITYAMLSERSGVPVGTLKSIFSYRTPTPRIDTLQAIETALGLSNDTAIPTELASLIDAIATLTDEECRAVSDYIDFVISKRGKQE